MPPVRSARAALVLGAKYPTMQEFKDAVTDFALKHHFPYKWAALKTEYAIAVCQREKSCEFRVRARYDKGNENYVVSVFNEGHVCFGQVDPKRAKHGGHKYLVELIGQSMSVDHSTKDAQIQAQLKQQYGIVVPQQSVNKARLAILGSRVEDQLAEFRQIEAWLERVKEGDPDARVEHVTHGDHFAGAFVCSGAARQAWPWCKPFFAVDGTWTKNKHGMVLLLAATMDADDNLIILGWAIVQSETHASWEWFLRTLLAAFPTVGAATTTIVSDRQKGLLSAIKTVLPSTIEAYCCWHLAENVKKRYGAAAQKQFWRLVYAASAPLFNSAMEQMRELNKDAAEYLRDSADGGIPHKYWACYAFPGRRFDHVTSNLSEIANSALRLHRELPPLQLLAGVYNYQMGMFHKRKTQADGWKQVLAPHPHSLFVEALVQARKMNCTPASEWTGLVVSTSGRQHNVKMAEDYLTGASVNQCSCGVPQWMLLPCPHLCALAMAVKKPPVLFAHKYWSTEGWRKTYLKSYAVAEVNALESNTLNAPEGSNRAKKGRPQKQRRESGQARSSSSSQSVNACTKCGDTDHNARQCRTSHSEGHS